MNEYVLINKSDLSSIANTVRSVSGSTELMSVADISTNLEVEVGTVKETLTTWLTNTGTTVDGDVSLKDLVEVTKETDGINTSDATATENEILLGKTAYVDGKKITGTIPTKTENDIAASGATITVPSGYYTTQAIKSVATAVQAVPSIIVDASGLITASVTQTAGYVTTGTKSTTKQLAFQAAKTITPSTTNQIAVSSGYYTGGDITVAGDSNLVAENIKSGVSIFGVNGTHSGNSGGTSVETCTVTIINNIGGSTRFVVATQFIDGLITSYCLEEHAASGSPLTIENVLCNSSIAFYANDAIIPAYSIDGTALYYAKEKNYWAFSTPSVPGESCTITLWDED